MCPECHSFCCLFHTSPCLTLLFHRYIVSHHFRCDPALSVFASKCQGECHAWTAALYDLGILAGGIPGFCIELCCFVHPLIWPLVFLSCFGSFVSCLGAIVVMTHKMSSCMNPYYWLQSLFLVCFWLVCCCFLVLLCVLVFGLM